MLSTRVIKILFSSSNPRIQLSSNGRYRHPADLTRAIAASATTAEVIETLRAALQLDRKVFCPPRSSIAARATAVQSGLELRRLELLVDPKARLWTSPGSLRFTSQRRSVASRGTKTTSLRPSETPTFNFSSGGSSSLRPCESISLGPSHKT